MLLYIDSCDTEEIKRALDTKIISGVTTTPTFAFRNQECYGMRLIKSIRKTIGDDCELYWTIASNDFDLIVRKCTEIYKLMDNDKKIIFKIPISYNAIKATSKLKELGIRTSMHLVYSINQSLLSSLSEVEAIFPLIGRTEDTNDGIQFVSDIQNAYRTNQIPTHIIAASVRNPQHVVEMYKLGIYASTIPYSVLEKLDKHSLTTKGTSDFERDYSDSKNYR